MIIGATKENDYQLLSTSQLLYLEGKAEVARPSDGSKHHLALILLGRLIESIRL